MDQAAQLWTGQGTGGPIAQHEAARSHLKILERRRLIKGWYDRQIVPGQDWEKAIDARLLEAQLVLLLVSMSFIRSDYIIGIELNTCMERQQRGECAVVWIKLREFDLSPDDVDALSFLNLQGTGRALATRARGAGSVTASPEA